MNAESLHMAALHAQTELAHLCLLAKQGAEALAAAEQRATKAEAALKRCQQRLAQRSTASADLVAAAQAYLDKVCDITTDEFACGAEKAEREALAAVLEAIAGEDAESPAQR